MSKKEILFFDQPLRRANTDEMVAFSLERIKELGVKTVVIAWDSGYSLYKFLEHSEKEKLDLNIVVVTNPKGGHLRGRLVSVPEETRLELKKKGIQTCYLKDYFNLGEPLDLEDNMKVRRDKLAAFGIPSHIRPMDIDVETDLSLLTIISQGFRVCVGITVLAVKNGFIPKGEYVLALAGVSTGLIVRASSKARGCLVKEILGYDRKYNSSNLSPLCGFEDVEIEAE